MARLLIKYFFKVDMNNGIQELVYNFLNEIFLTNRRLGS
jgi:hypothetical protein